MNDLEQIKKYVEYIKYMLSEFLGLIYGGGFGIIIIFVAIKIFL